jgi:hypothetical protein
VNADLSVAPEIAQLAVPPGEWGGGPPHARGDSGGSSPRANTAPRTPGRAAGELTRLAAAPQRWWDLVRFDPGGPVRIPVPGTAGAWLLVLPPGAAAPCDCEYATLLAGEAAESSAAHPAAAVAPLHAGRVRVHGRPARHWVRGAGHGYSVSMHVAATIPPGE